MSYENFVKTKVVTPLAIGTTSFALEAASAPNNLPPLDGGLLVLCDSPGNPSFIEVIRYGYRDGLALYEVQRGQEGTAAREWIGPTYCFQSLMAGEFNTMVATLAGKEPAIAVGTSSQYWSGTKNWVDFFASVRSATLTGLSLTVGTAVVAGDSLLVAAGKLQKQVTDIVTNLAANVRATVLTGYVSGSNVPLANTDSVLTAFGKAQAQLNAKLDALANAVSATKLATARTISLTGDATGSASFDGSANASITVAVGNDTHTHDTRHPALSAEQSLVVASADWVTIASVPLNGGRAFGEFLVYDTDSSKHSFVKIQASHSYGQSSVAAIGGNRFGTSGITHVRVLYNTADPTYGGAKLQVYCAGAVTVRVRALMTGQIVGWTGWSTTVPVLEGSPAGWTEDPTTRFDNVTDTATSFNGAFAGVGTLLTGLNAANLASGIVPDARLSGTYNGVNISGTAGSIAGFGNPTTTATGSRIAYRDTAGDVHARLFRSEYADGSTMSGGLAFRVNNSTDNFIRTCSNPKAVSDWLRIGLTAAGSTADPNTTVEHEILTNHANSPSSASHWYITTTFYSTIGTGSNRSQVAVSYSGGTRMYVRYYLTSAWSEWQVCGEDSGDINPTLVNSFTQGTTPLQYRKVNGIVFIIGQVNRSAIPLGTTIFTLPVGYRPSKNSNCFGELYGTGNQQRTAFSFAALSTGDFNAIWTASPSTGDTPTGPFTFNINISFPAA